MSVNSEISWTHHTFNSWWGCTRVSPGCEHCYAETFAKRTGLVWGPRAERRFFGENHWNEPLKWNRKAEEAGERHRVFCASMADVFEDRPELAPWRERLWDLILKTPSLDWLLLTKRPENAVRMTPQEWAAGWPANIWAMTTAEDQVRANARIPHLLRIPAVIHGLSCEPLLGPVDLQGVEMPDGDSLGTSLFNHGEGWGIDWVIAGGESGHGARQMRPEWVRDLRDQCCTAGIAFHFKQWGEYDPDSGRRVGKKSAGRILDGREWIDFPEVRQ